MKWKHQSEMLTVSYHMNHMIENNSQSKIAEFS